MADTRYVSVDKKAFIEGANSVLTLEPIRDAVVHIVGFGFAGESAETGRAQAEKRFGQRLVKLPALKKGGYTYHEAPSVRRKRRGG